MSYLMMEVKSVRTAQRERQLGLREWVRACVPRLTFHGRFALLAWCCCSPHDVDDTDTKTTFWRATFLAYMRHVAAHTDGGHAATPPHSSAAAAVASAALPATPAAAHAKPPLSFSLQEAQKAMMRVSVAEAAHCSHPLHRSARPAGSSERSHLDSFF